MAGHGDGNRRDCLRRRLAGKADAAPGREITAAITASSSATTDGRDQPRAGSAGASVSTVLDQHARRASSGPATLCFVVHRAQPQSFAPAKPNTMFTAAAHAGAPGERCRIDPPSPYRNAPLHECCLRTDEVLGRVRINGGRSARALRLVVTGCIKADEASANPPALDQIDEPEKHDGADHRDEQAGTD